MTKLKAFADNKLNIAKMTISFVNTVENSAGKGENAVLVTSIFSFSHSVSQTLLFKVAKTLDCVVKS